MKKGMLPSLPLFKQSLILSDKARTAGAPAFFLPSQSDMQPGRVYCLQGLMHMIDLHCHILPGIDDGARDLSISLEMAQIAWSDGIMAIACTPHITPGIYDNHAGIILDATEALQACLHDAGIDLQLFSGADIHVAPEMGERICSGVWPSLAGSRYFLFEPPHHVLPPNIHKLARKLLDMGLVPLLTHPERLSWIEKHYDVITTLNDMGVRLQITAGAITGRFGSRPRYWAERMLEEGRVDIIATDAHNVRGRPPLLREGYEAAARIVGEDAAWCMVHDNPLRVLLDEPLPAMPRQQLPAAGGRPRSAGEPRKGLLDWLHGTR